MPLRVVSDLFTEDFERALVDDDRALRRITGYLKKTSPHMAERVVRYKDRTPLFEAHGVDADIRSTLNKRVDLPSGGYLVFDYAEAFTVIDVNTGRFVGSRSRTSTARLEETVTKNNVEAAKEVVRQLRLRDIGGIIVIDFVDMANPKNRATVEEALKRELERDRTKTYVVEISPLGLVEMTRQNVTEGPREILTRRCPTCEGNGTILSEASAVVDTERRLRALAGESPRTKAFRVELNARVRDHARRPRRRPAGRDRGGHEAPLLPRAQRTTRRSNHFDVLDRGPLVEAPAADGARRRSGARAEARRGRALRPRSRRRQARRPRTSPSRGAAKLVGKKVRVRVERVLERHGVRHARSEPLARPLRRSPPRASPRSRPGLPARGRLPRRPQPKSPKRPRRRRWKRCEAVAAVAEETGEEPAAPKKKRTRRGSRGGRNRRKKPAAAAGAPTAAAEAEAATATEEPVTPKIHLPAADLGAEPAADAANGDEATAEAATPKKKKTRRGSRGGKRRRKPAAVSAETDPAP